MGLGAVAEFDRIGLKLGAINTYAVVGALMMNAGLRLHSAVKMRRSTRRYRVISFIFSVCNVLSVLCGAYSTVIFTLLTLYSKSALGLNQDAYFTVFYAETQKFRQGV